jgi:glycosyltransferase involved in cell wall biosynthesis
MRVAFIDVVGDPTRPGRTGLSDLVWDMARNLARKGIEVHIIAPYTVEANLDPRVRVHRFAVPALAYRNVLGQVWISLLAYRELLRHGPFALVHVPEYLSSAVFRSFGYRKPIIFTEPGNIYERLANGNPYDWLTTQVYKWAARVTARHCAHFIATSDLMKCWWHWTGVTPERATLVPLGIDTQLFRAAPNARAELGISERQTMVLYVARLSRENGLDVALKAMALLRERNPTAVLHVVGHGPERERYQQLCTSLGIEQQVVWHGWIDLYQLPLYYSAADLLVFPGFSGGTPRVILQAMACGLPVVASAIGGIVDHIEHEVSGLLFPSGQSSMLAEQIERILNDLPAARSMARVGQQYVLNNLSWEVLVEQIEQVYRQVASLSSDAAITQGAYSYSGQRMGHE